MNHTLARDVFCSKERALRVDLAAAFQSAARLGLIEGVANHFSATLDTSGRKFLINPNQVHFSRITASSLVLVDLDTPGHGVDRIDPTAWGLHGAIHSMCTHANCVIHLHPIYSTVLSSLADSYMRPIDQNTATFFKRHVIDADFSGLAVGKEGLRCATMLKQATTKVVVMGNHGILVVGHDIADCFNRAYYFERAAQTYIQALQTGQPLRIMSDEIAERTAQEVEKYPDQALRHFEELKAILDEIGSNYSD